ncbi:MAG: hypothetical protein A2096_15445 [Spirochaetes bacterium GWF1_41_5]|nr:MAG: hypothetical protein A2096_15445 [Spirochaetes bacterium GWF1_41_5]
MIRINILFIILILALHCQDKNSKPFINDTGQIVLFDAAKHGIDVIQNKSASWKPYGGDLIPVVKSSIKDTRQFAEVTYTGSTGMAISTINFDNIPISTENMVYSGVNLFIDYDKDDFGKCRVSLFFSDKSSLGKDLTMKKGLHEYLVTSGFRRETFPPKWELLQYIWLSITDKNDKNIQFRLQKIVLSSENLKPSQTSESSENRINLAIDRIRKIQEIMPVSGQIICDGLLNDKAWQKAKLLSNFYYHKAEEVKDNVLPWKVALVYDEKNLYIGTSADYPSEPLARIKNTDGDVWQDECQEFFFSPWNDNEKKIQYDLNALGTVFDYIREYDKVTVNVRTMKEINLVHNKAMRYSEGKWRTEIVFPLSELRIDLRKERYAGFMAAISFINRNMKNFAWEENIASYTDTGKWGVLIFNKNEFGPGSININHIQKMEKESKADFYINCTFSNFFPGTYRLQLKLSGLAEGICSNEIVIPAEGASEKTIIMESIPDVSGLYSLYAAMFNRDDDIRLAAVNFINQKKIKDLFGDIHVLDPKPKKVIWRDPDFFPCENNKILYHEKNASLRTKRTAELFAERYYGYTGVKLSFKEYISPLPDHGIILRINQTAEFTNCLVSLRKNGYHLDIGKTRALITGCDEAGLHYGGITFIQLIKNSMRITANRPVPCAEILDWPDLDVRLCRLDFFWPPKGVKPEKRGIDFLINWTERMMTGLKLNFLMIELGGLVIYKRRPELNGIEKHFSMADLTRFADYCRDNFIDVCPAWQVGGHSSWLLNYLPDMREKGWSGQGDASNPEYLKIIFDCMQDVIDAMSPKYISPKCDEWWHKRNNDEIVPVLHNGKTESQVLLDFLLQMHEFTARQGIRALIFHDMLTPYHSGKNYDLYKIIDRIPRDYIIQQWTGEEYLENLNYFTDKGFSVWGNATGYFGVPNKYKPLFSGHGASIYNGYGNYHSDLNPGLKDMPSYNLCNLYNLFRLADHTWNFSSDTGSGSRNVSGLNSEIKEGMESGFLGAVRSAASVSPNPRAGEEIETLNIDSLMTQTFSSWLRSINAEGYAGPGKEDEKEGIPDIGFVPMRFYGENKKNCIPVTCGSVPVEILVEKELSSLFFLHTAYINDPEDAGKKKQRISSWMYGFPCGDYEVWYSDGTMIKIPLRLTMNIARYNRDLLASALYDVRYIHVFYDAADQPIQLYQMEWVNPKPEMKIVKIILRHDNILTVTPVLFAISDRKVKK